MNALDPSSQADGDFVVLGRVVDAYGLRGQLRIHPFGDDPQSWKSMPQWWLRDERGDGIWQAVKLKQLRLRGDADVVVALEGCDDRSAAEARKGWLVGAPREALPATADDEYYWADLVGLEVVNGDGASLGRVDSLIETGANDVLRVIDNVGTERLLPFVGAVVLAVDKAAGRIRVEWGLDW